MVAAALGGLRPARLPQDRARASRAPGRAALSAISARATAGSRRPGTPPQVAQLDNVQGDIDTLADRHRRRSAPGPISPSAPTGSPTPAAMAERAAAVEERLSDALHERLTQRFVDRRTAVLMRDVGRKGAGEFPVIVDEQGEVTVGTYADRPAARASPSRSIRPRATPTARCCSPPPSAGSAANMSKRAAALVADTDEHFTLRTEPGRPVAISGAGTRSPGSARARICSSPRVAARPAARPAVAARRATRSIERLEGWVRHQVERALAPLRAAGHAAQDRGGAGGGARAAAPCWSTKAASSRASRWPSRSPRSTRSSGARHRLGVRIGALDLFMPACSSPRRGAGARRLRAAAAGEPMPACRRNRRVVLPARRTASAPAARLGFRAARPADAPRRHGRAAAAPRPRGAQPASAARSVDEALATSLGLQPQAVARLMRDIGFRPAEGDARPGSGAAAARRAAQDRGAPADARSADAFAALAGLAERG